MEETKAEIWKTVPSFEDYEASDQGHIRRKDTQRVMSIAGGKDTYVKITFHAKGTTKCCCLHRVVAETFLPNPNNLPQVDHIDRNPRNNVLSNLQWVTAAQNNQNRRVGSYGTKRHVCLMDEKGEILKTFTSIGAAAIECQIGKDQIKDSLRGRSNKGKWKYCDTEHFSGETWGTVEIEGEIFTVSDMGRIKGRHGRLTFGHKKTDGYFVFSQKKIMMRVHRLVAMVHVLNPNPKEFDVVNHLDSNRGNNTKENLEWTNLSGNTKHAAENGQMKRRPVDQFDMKGNHIKTWVSINEAERELGKCGIWGVLKGVRKTCGGFVWKDVEQQIDDENKSEE